MHSLAKQNSTQNGEPMFSYRITKYNPAYRNSQGHYLKNEWILYADIGKEFDDGVLTLEQYLKVENAYVDAILSFMECLGIETLHVTALEKNVTPRRNELFSLSFFNNLENGSVLNTQLIKVVTAMILRNYLWCKFEAPGMYVHFGWDYYMYIGSAKACKTAIRSIEKSGLFVEEYESPYNDNEDVDE
jgi:hypothetical protein